MGTIIANTTIAKQVVIKNEFDNAKVAALLANIDADIALLGNTPTNVEFREIVARILQRQRKVIRFVASRVED